MATDFDTVRDQYENFRFAYDNGHSDFLRKAEHCFEMYRGNQWDPKDKAQLVREGRPALTLNVIESLVRAMQGMHKALRNDVRFMPIADAGMQDAYVRDMLWLQCQQHNDFDMIESDMYLKGLIMSRAYVDVRMGFDDNLQGHVKIAPRRSQDVILSPSADQYDPDTWPEITVRRWVSYNDIRSQYGKEKADAVGQNLTPSFYDYEDKFMAQQMGQRQYYQHTTLEGSETHRGRLMLDRQYYVMKKKEMFVDIKTGDMSEVPENWDRAKISYVLENSPDLSTIKRETRTVRWTVSCDAELMHNEDSPYRWFTTVPYFPTFVGGVSMCPVEAMIDSQLMLNKVSSQELHIINTTANSGYKLKKGALKNMTVSQLETSGARSGVVIELDDINNIEKIQPNQTPQGHDRLSSKAEQIMRNLGGISDQGRGFAREDMADAAIMSNQAAQEINSASWLSNLHYTKSLIARRVNDLHQSFYTDTRTILANKGTTLSPDIQTLSITNGRAEHSGMPAFMSEIARGKFSTVLVPSPARASMSEADFKLMLELRKLGIGIPDEMLIELSPATNKAQIMQKLQGDSNAAAAEAAKLEAETAAAKNALTNAQAGKEQTAGMLNKARADKFAVEAVSDPEATYERVEMARIKSDGSLNMARLAQENDHHQDNVVLKRMDIAVKSKAAETRSAVAKKTSAPQKPKGK